MEFLFLKSVHLLLAPVTPGLLRFRTDINKSCSGILAEKEQQQSCVVLTLELSHLPFKQTGILKTIKVWKPLRCFAEI